MTVEKLILSKKENVKIISQGYFKREGEWETIAKAMQRDFLSHRNFDEIFEEERSGYLYFDIDISEGANIDISYGEHLDDLRARSDIITRNFEPAV